jgi:hypothetical protein
MWAAARTICRHPIHKVNRIFERQEAAAPACEMTIRRKVISL